MFGQEVWPDDFFTARGGQKVCVCVRERDALFEGVEISHFVHFLSPSPSSFHSIPFPPLSLSLSLSLS